MPNISDSHIQLLLNAIQNQDDGAFEQFWNLHFDGLVALARRKMQPYCKRIHDEEDIAVSAIHSFYKGLSEKRFHSISGNNELWKILATIVCRKIFKSNRDQNRQKRGGGKIRGDSFFDAGGKNNDKKTPGIGNVADNNVITPYLEVEFLDTCENLFEMLEDESTRNVARLIMEGYSIDDTAEELGCVRRTVERKLAKIREKWSHLKDTNTVSTVSGATPAPSAEADGVR
ncbi:MAG: hypothetical protein LBU65_04160 [Planctomycetaceae bacterium]|jgi:DNA-directed RNA polymerase specialized sigma24 family protein|nr:hypothetical protein [Planctomycetaceae bacterium]